MKIVLVVDQFDSSNNGTTVTARRYAEELRKRGHEVTILAGGEPMEHKISVPVHRIPFFQKLIESQGMRFAKPVDEAYYQAFREADIVHFYMPFRFCRRGEELARQMHKPVVAAFHVQPENITSSIGLGKNKVVNRFLYWWFYHVFYNRFRFIHCPSRFIANQLKEHHYTADLRVISNGVDDAFRPVEGSRKPEWKGKFVVLMVGRLSGEKRQDLIIEAAKKSKYADKIQLVFAGQGPKEAEYRRLSKGLVNEPVFSFYTKDELVKLINGCDLYVHASDAEIEGISCMEALACGLVPVIANSKLSATPQFALDDRSLFRAGDAADLAAKIDYWIENPQEKESLKERYVQQGNSMRVSTCVAQAEKMYEDAIADFQHNGYPYPVQTRVRKMTHPDAYKVIEQYQRHSPIRRGITSLFTNLLSPILYAIDWLFLGFSVKGRENLDQISGGAVSVMNHVHPMDCTMAKLALFPSPLYFISLRRNIELPFIGWLIKLCGALPIPYSAVKIARLQRSLKEGLNEGEWIHYYPEGMLVRYHKGFRPFHNGAFVTAVNAQMPVVPMVIVYEKPYGIRKLWRKKPFLQLRIGQPQYPNAFLPRKQSIAELSTRTLCEMERLKDQDPLGMNDAILVDDVG